MLETLFKIIFKRTLNLCLSKHNNILNLIWRSSSRVEIKHEGYALGSQRNGGAHQ